MAMPSNLPDFKIFYHRQRGFADTEAIPVSYGFFGRQGGVSTGVYSSLNCGPGSEDAPESVQKNRRIVADILGVGPSNLLSLYQLHGDSCLKVTQSWSAEDRPQADAMVTDVPGLALGILTADCAPVLFYAQSSAKTVIGAAHAGWGGALKGILESTVAAMEDLGAKREAIRACIGPCIHQSSYEVSAEFHERFMVQHRENGRFFQPGQKAGRFMFDLAGYCVFRLYGAGISRVYIKDLDTYFNEEDFFSYRRATHRDEKDYGRQISAIAIK